MFYWPSLPADDSFLTVGDVAEKLKGPHSRDGVYNVKLAELLTERGAVRCDADLVLGARVPHVLGNWCEVRFVLEVKYDYSGSVAQIPPVFKIASMPSGTHWPAPVVTGFEINSDSGQPRHSGCLWAVSAPLAPRVHQANSLSHCLLQGDLHTR